MDTVEQRIAQLEQKLEHMGSALERAEQAERTWRGKSNHAGRGMRLAQVAAACGAVATIGALTMGTVAAKPGPQPLTVKAPFRVLDNAGYPGLVYDGTNLHLYYGGRESVVLGPGDGGEPVVQVFNSKGEATAALQSLPDGTGELAVAGEAGHVARLRTISGQQTLTFYKGNALQVGIGAVPGGGLVEVNDAAGKQMAHLSSNGKTGTIQIYDVDGSARAVLGSDLATGEAELDLLYRDGKTPAVRLAEVGNGGYFSLTNRSGIARVEGGTLSGSDVGILRAFGPGGFDFVRGRK